MGCLQKLENLKRFSNFWRQPIPQFTDQKSQRSMRKLQIGANLKETAHHMETTERVVLFLPY